MKYKLTIILTFLAVIFGYAQEIEYVIFPETRKPIIERITISPVLLHSNRMICNEEYLLSMSLKNDTIYQVFSLPECKYIGGFGLHGNGPGDFIQPSVSNFAVDGNEFLLGDLKYFRTIKIPSGTRTVNNIIEIERERISGSIREIGLLNKLNDSIIVGYEVYYSPKQIMLFNQNTQRGKHIIDYPNICKRVPHNIMSALYLRYFVLSGSKAKIAIVYRRFPMLRIYDIWGSLLVDIRLKESVRQKEFDFSAQRPFRGSYTYYHNLVATEDYIYALYKEGVSFGKDPDSSTLEIHVFDWGGNPIAKILLEDWMTTFTVSPDDRYIYFFNPDVEDALYRAKLN